MTGIIFLLKKLINFLKQNKDLKVKEIMFLMKKLTKVLQVQMMIKECSQLIRQEHMHMEGAKIQYK